MNRIQAFQSLSGHTIYGKVLTRLGPSGRDYCLRFLEQHEKSNKEEFAVAIRNLLVAPNKPTNVLLVDEVLSAANTRSDK